MQTKIIYSEISKLHAFKTLKKYSLNILTETISSFFSCSVKVISTPERYFSDYFNINIHDNIKRGFYPINDESVLILGRMFKENQLISAIGFHVTEIDVRKQARLLNIFERLLSKYLTNERQDHFQNASLLFGDEIIKETITEYISRGHYDSRQIRHLIEYFFKLRTTSFEGDYFSTGAIFTKSRDILRGDRYGHVKELNTNFYISDTDKIDKRIWYLVDGKTSYFLGNKNLCFNNVFILNDEYSKTSFLETHSLALTLKGGDFLIKVENEKLLSICCSDGSEFIFFENQWRYRNYTVLKEILTTNITTDEEIIGSLLFYILSSSKKQFSTILWFPDNMDEIDSYINPKTKNIFLKENINIKDKRAINHIFRCISSDGASIFDRNGDLMYIGVIINIQKATANGMTGTGESAASVLSANGISIKISSDGLIKIFTSRSSIPYVF